MFRKLLKDDRDADNLSWWKWIQKEGKSFKKILYEEL
jgi:hypothetical protein